jgi:inorganic pyrophosphatase/exopolyphosphatase
MELLKQDIKVYDEKAAKLALEEAATVSVEAETFEMLRSELAALESQVWQCAGQAGVDRVGLLITASLSAIPHNILFGFPNPWDNTPAVILLSHSLACSLS